MKKRLLMLLLSACLVVPGLTGCGNSDEDYEEAAEDNEDEDEDDVAEAEEEDDYADEDWDSDTEESDDGDNAAGNAGKTSEGRGDTWSIFVYLCGTDLESDGGDATENLEEMASAVPSDKVNVVIETGGCSEWQYWETDIPTDELGRFMIKDSELEMVETKESACMSKVETLQDFLSWGVENYPADKYMAVIWDHGGGSVDGVIHDENYPDEDTMSVKDVAKAVGAVGQTFEVVGFDACLMSTVENASALCPYARYMVASEELEPGEGWDYTDWINYLAENPAMTGDTLGKRIVDGFYNKCDSSGQAYECTLAVTDLSKIPALVESFNKMAEEMKGYTNDVSRIKTITGAFKKSESYGGNNDDEGYSDMVDLGDMILNAEGVLSDTGEKVIDDLLAAVVYHKNGESRSKGEGLSVYVPLSLDEENFERYAQDAAISGEYLTFLGKLYQFEVPTDTEIVMPVAAASSSADENIQTENVDLSSVEEAPDIDYRDDEITYDYKVNDEGYVEADITSGADLITEVKCNLYYYDPDEKIYYDLGSDYNVNSNDDGTVMQDNFDDTWIFINGVLSPMKAGNIADSYIEYYVPVMLNNERTNLKMLYRFDTDKFEVIGTWDGIGENGLSSRKIRKLKDGDEINFIMKAKKNEKAPEEEVVYEGFTVSGPVEVTEEDLGDGKYGYSMEFDDVFGKSTETNWADITVENGEIEVSIN